MKIGDILVAINLCKMEGEEKCALTVGREYSIQGIQAGQLWIFDNQEDRHWYNLEGEDKYTRWFRKGNVEEEIY